MAKVVKANALCKNYIDGLYVGLWADGYSEVVDQIQPNAGSGERDAAMGDVGTG